MPPSCIKLNRLCSYEKNQVAGCVYKWFKLWLYYVVRLKHPNKHILLLFSSFKKIMLLIFCPDYLFKKVCLPSSHNIYTIWIISKLTSTLSFKMNLELTCITEFIVLTLPSPPEVPGLPESNQLSWLSSNLPTPTLLLYFWFWDKILSCPGWP